MCPRDVGRTNVKTREQGLASRLLAWIVGLILAAGCTVPLRALLVPQNPQHDRFTLWAGIVSLTFAAVVWALRAATPIAALCGGMICLLVTVGTGRGPSMLQTALTPLMALFVLTFLATRAGRTRKAALGLAEPKRGRNAAQVIANLGMPGLLVVAGFSQIAWFERFGPAMLLAALAEATADTVSSEIGQAFGGQPILLTTFKRAAPGTDGAVTLLGTLAGTLGACAIAAISMLSMNPGWPGALSALAGGLIGLWFDTFLGATLESAGWLNNDWVNFLSTAAAALAAAACLKLFALKS